MTNTQVMLPACRSGWKAANAASACSSTCDNRVARVKNDSKGPPRYAPYSAYLVNVAVTHSESGLGSKHQRNGWKRGS